MIEQEHGSWVHGATVAGEGVSVGPNAVVGVTPRSTAANRRPLDAKNLSAIRLGDRTRIGAFAAIYLDIHMGDDCIVGNHGSIREGCRFGHRCVVGAHTDIQYNVTVGDDVKILNGTQITGNSVIGRGVFIGPGVQSMNDSQLFRFDAEDYQHRGQDGVVIGDYVRIGGAAILLPGIKIGDRAVIAAGALVARDVPAGATIVASGVRGLAVGGIVGSEGVEPVLPR